MTYFIKKLINKLYVCMFYKKIFSNKFDLFWTRTLFLYNKIKTYLILYSLLFIQNLIVSSLSHFCQNVFTDSFHYSKTLLARATQKRNKTLFNEDANFFFLTSLFISTLSISVNCWTKPLKMSYHRHLTSRRFTTSTSTNWKNIFESF